MRTPDDADTIFEAWRLDADRGGQPDPESVIRANPDLAAELRLRFDAVRLLDGEFAEGRAHRPPEHIGSYRIVRELGRGGMGVVYEAVQESMDRPVALKVLFPSVAPAGHAVRRFRQEARIAGSLKHTNIVAVHDLGQEAGLWYCAMELVDGPPLSRVIEQVVSHAGGGRGERPPSGTPSTLTGEASGGSSHFRRVARMFAEVADALGVAHEAGVLHRDVKPSNLLLDKAGHLRLVDFGLARLESDQSHLTRTGDVVGTPLYMSPEHFRGRDVSPRSDVYSLGATLYEVLTLRPPHDPKDATLLAAEVVTKDSPRPRSIDPTVPRDLETVVLKALEKDPARRYATAAAFADDLRAVAAGDVIRAKRAGPLARAWRISRRHPARFTAVVALLGLIAAAGLLWVRTGAERDSERARAYDRLLLRHLSKQRGELLTGESREDPDLWRRATATLDEAIRLDPNRPEAHAYRAGIHAGSWEERSADLERARERGLPDRTYHILRALGLRLFEHTAEAEREERIASTLPEPAPQWFNEDLLWAFSLQIQGRWAAVVDRCTQALSRLPATDRRRALALDWRSRAKEKMGDYLGALEDLAGTQSEGTPPWPIQLARMAHLWRLALKPERAEAQFGEALEAAASQGSRDDWEAFCDSLRRSAEWQWLDRAAATAMSRYPSAARFAGERSAALAALGRNAEAVGLANAGLTIDSACAFCREQRGLAQAKLGRHKAALEDFRAAGSITLQMRELFNLGRPGDALALARSETVAHPETHQAWCDLARFLFATNSSAQEALSAVDQALRYNSTACATCHHDRSQILLRLGRYQEALDAVDRAIAIDPRLPWVHYTRSECLQALHRTPEALSSTDRAVELAPQVADFHHTRGFLLGTLGQYTEGISACDRALTLAPDLVMTRQLRAKLRICAGQADLALQDAELALARPGPGNKNWRGIRHEALVATGDLRGALAACDVPDSDPDASLYQRARAQLLSWQGKFDEALEVLHRRMSAHPPEPLTPWAAAVVMVWAGRPEEALAIAKSIPQVEGPGRTAADESACWLYLMAGKEVEARALAVRSLADSGPNQLPAQAWMLALVGRKEEARASLAMEMPPGDYNEAYRRASVHALLGDHDESLRWLGHAADWGYRRSVKAIEDPQFQDLKGDLRYQGLMERILLQ